MDIPSTPPSTIAAAAVTANTTTITDIASDDRIQPNNNPKQLPPPLTNGVLKRHKPHHHVPPVVVTYKECLKNHAASLGGHALDGCGEFMPLSMSSPSDPTSIKCAACGCHRNFHRRDPDPSFPQHIVEYQPHHRHHPPPPPPPHPISVAGARDPSLSPADSPSPPPISSSYYLSLSSALPLPSGGKKRFRTKFTNDQKERMHELADRVGWKMQKKDEELIIGFCNKIGVEKGVFKVWMHNNKMTFGKKDAGIGQHLDSGSSGGGVDFFNRNQHHHDQLQPSLQNNDTVSSGGCGGNGIGTNGSSSSC